MHELVSLNGRICKKTDANLIGVSGAALFGKGIFTTVAIYDGRASLWEKHWNRLVAAAAKLDVSLDGFTEGTVLKAVDEIVTRNALRTGRARVTFFDESATEIWEYEGAQKTSLLIMTGESRTASDNFRVELSPHLINSTSPLAGVKSCNYLEHLLAYQEAKGRGFDEAIRCNERGEVTSACLANVFWLKGDRMFTPSLKTGCLAGTTREFALENIHCEEVETGVEAVRDADAVFLTSAGLSVVSVDEFNGRELRGKDHPILRVGELLKSVGDQSERKLKS